MAIHLQEWQSDKGHPWDYEALRTLITDQELIEFLNDPKYKVFLPVKR